MLNFIYLIVWAQIGFALWLLFAYPVVGCVYIVLVTFLVALVLLMRRFPAFRVFVTFFLFGLMRG